MAEKVNEKLIEKDLAEIENLFGIAWHNSFMTTEALLERLRVEIMISRPSRRKRRVYRALIDYIEDVLEERYADEEQDRPEKRKQVMDYIKGVLNSVDD